MLIQEIHAMRTNRDEIKSEASRLSRLVYECRDQISSLTARLKIYEDVNEADQRSSRLLLTSIQQSKSCWTLNAESTCHTSSNYRNKSVDNLNDVSPLNDMNKTEDGYDLQSTLNKVCSYLVRILIILESHLFTYTYTYTYIYIYIYLHIFTIHL